MSSKKSAYGDAGRPKTMTLKSALKGSDSVSTHTIQPTPSSSSSNHDGRQKMPKYDEYYPTTTDDARYIHVKEAKPLAADIYKVTKKKSKHKVRHDIYHLDEKMFGLLRAYSKCHLYPPMEVMLHVSRIYQFEHGNEYLADIKVQQDGEHIVADGPKGGRYRLSSSSGKKKYLS